MPSLLIDLLRDKTVMLESVDIQPVMVLNEDRIIMIAVLAFAHRMKEYLQISFFEAIEDNPEAFNLILDQAIKMAKEKGARKLSGSLNVHVNYGLGFLADNFHLWQSFGSPHNPDFHQLMKPGETVGVKTVIKNNFFSNRMDTFKIVEIGVVPEEQKKGAILALFDYCYEKTKGKYEHFESGWVFKDNFVSYALGARWADDIYKNFNAYTRDIDDEV